MDRSRGGTGGTRRIPHVEPLTGVVATSTLLFDIVCTFSLFCDSTAVQPYQSTHVYFIRKEVLPPTGSLLSLLCEID